MEINPKGRPLVLTLLTAIFTVVFSTVFAQDPGQYSTPFSGVPDTRDITIYQVNIRAFSPGSNLAGVTSRLDKIKELGANVVYLMPVFPVGTDARSKVASAASPYCVKDFTAVGTEYGTLADLRNLVEGAHSRGMAVMLDWVVNQTSWDHPWITQHPDWYVRDANGVIQPLGSYPDVAALDVNNVDLRNAMIKAMRYWIFAANVDGFRCDFADNPGLDFWKQTIDNLRSIKAHKLLMLAEGERVENFNAGFDLNYGFKFYNNALKPIHAGAPVTTIQTTTDIEYTYANATQQIARYTGNHDTNGSEGTPLEVFGGTAGVMTNFVVAAYMKGVPFIYGGQEVAFAQRIPFPWDGVDIDWSQNANVTEEFKNVIGFRNSSTAIRRGVMANYSDLNICAFTKIAGTEKVLVFSNLRGTASNYVMPAALAGTYQDAFTGATVTLTAGATLALKGFEYRTLTTMNIPAFTRIAVSPLNTSIVIGATQQLTATITPLAAKNKSVTWSSSNASVATVDASGLVTGIAKGSVTITATINGNKIATSAVTVMEPNRFTVNFYKPVGWGTGVNVYWYNAQPAGSLPSPAWPGVSMTDNGDGWYSYTFTNISATTVIFNDGTRQSADLTRDKTGWYVNGIWYDTKPEVSTNTFTVNFFRPSGWGTGVNVYWYNAQPASAPVSPSWPGASMTDNGDGWYSYTFTNTDAAVLIFNDGTNQTPDGSRDRTGWYLNGTWYDTKPQIPSNGFTVNFYKPAGWGTGVNVYWYNAQPAGSLPSPAWPGVSMTDNRDGWYSYTFKDISSAVLIFNDDTNQTADGVRDKTGWYVNGTWYDTKPGIALSSATSNLLAVNSAAKATDDEAQTATSVQLFPNPAKDNVFSIYIPGLPKNEVATVFVLDVNGRIALKTEVHQSAIISHNLTAGIYIVRIRTKGMSITKKLIVE